MGRSGRVTVVTWFGGGNTPPMLEIARRLRARGHDVSVCGPVELQQPVADAGARLVVPEGAVYPDMTSVGAGSDGNLLDEMMFGLDSARSIAAVLAATHADVAVVDCMQFAAIVAASASGVPTIPFLHTRYGFFTEPPLREFVDAWIGPPLAEVRQALGLEGFDDHPSIARQVWEPAPVAVSMLPPSLESELAAPVGNLVHAGPLFPRVPEPSRRSGDPKVLVSFSTTMMGQSDVMGRVVAALGTLAVTGLVTLGGVPLSIPTPPPNVALVPWVDPFDELPETSLVVTHAGMGTVLATLAHGVPLLALPMGRDQDGNAARVEEIGAGRALPLDAPVERIAEGIAEVLGERAYADAADGVAAEIRALDAGAAAIAAIERLLGDP